MKESRNILERTTGFSLIEVLAAMVIGSMVLIAVLTVYTRAEKTVAAVTRTLNDSRRPHEALQLIAEDLDKMITTNSDSDVIIVNRHINNYTAAIFALRVDYKDPTNKSKSYEEILWQCNKNHDGDANDMVLYRSYEGITPEDKLLDKNRTNSEKNVYVPICNGVTYFDVKVFTGKEEPESAFPGNGIPLGVTLTISFAEPFKNDDGNYDVPESEKYSRTVALDKSRKIKFDISEDESLEGEPIKINPNTLSNTGSPSIKADIKRK